VSSWPGVPEPEPDLTEVGSLVQELERQAALLISVATGGPRIEAVQAEYTHRRQRLLGALARRGLDYPFPWTDLWSWYGHWSANLPGYASRRTHVRELVAPTLDALERQQSGLAVTDPRAGAVPSWADLDGRVAGIVTELATATTPDDLQDVGRRSREVLIDCAQLLAEPSLVPPGATAPKDADAKAWLDLFMAKHAAGSSRDELRKLIRAAWDLSQKVTHGDLGHIDAFAAAQATVLVIRVLQELATSP
jgi:transcriptional regulator of NAD metabolism